ncbi:tRNA (adenosine(37)-N6)-dimethylallyltransferase MiaA [Mucilaginibacter ginsenosidivorans]|uniref:tRNA dimethylallyltransferase n=1 Tax=Mucilaginibacter ginsenosidivorans TaxID=398053 RepID=A0A5B8V1P9_9SPHI|nr:tRNA (adenosine(37)-N6)-dimethylallyltransferase MiaA [Mucilaginibacter ginsenosidivorans]QEC65098.1 tRNA (adenosine(37)-N6)-dimethylallyltransferase MiaA [Mucilaginibacter ginsenosidivorans]
MSTLKTLLVIVGPTASGKTALAIEVAKKLQTEIISADSRQFYREMSIGTAKPTPEELDQAKHYFVDSHSIAENFSVGDFEKQGLELLETIFKRHDTAVMVGGSGLYIRAICEGFDELPSASAELRTKLNKDFEDRGIAYLQERLKQADPVYFERVDINNPQRIIRALEVFESTGVPFSAYHKSVVDERPFKSIKIGIDFPRELLYQRINQRVDDMVKQGLIEEAKALLPYRHLNALNTVGYSELFNYFDGKTDLESAISLIKQNTRRFAKRQLTWFRKDQDIKWLQAGSAGLSENALEYLSEL